MLADVGTVITYSNSAHVNDLGFAWTGPPCCMDRPSSLFLQFFCQVVLPCRYTLHHPYICSCFYTFMECKLLMGQSTFKASKQQ